MGCFLTPTKAVYHIRNPEFILHHSVLISLMEVAIKLYQLCLRKVSNLYSSTSQVISSPKNSSSLPKIFWWFSIIHEINLVRKSFIGKAFHNLSLSNNYFSSSALLSNNFLNVSSGSFICTCLSFSLECALYQGFPTENKNQVGCLLVSTAAHTPP